jgi:hypothetical protein
MKQAYDSVCTNAKAVEFLGFDSADECQNWVQMILDGQPAEWKDSKSWESSEMDAESFDSWFSDLSQLAKLHHSMQ